MSFNPLKKKCEGVQPYYIKVHRQNQNKNKEKIRFFFFFKGKRKIKTKIHLLSIKKEKLITIHILNSITWI